MKTGAYDKLDELGEEAIFSRVAAAETMKEIAESVGVDRVTLWRWIRRGGDARMTQYRAAQVQAADIFAEEAVRILDEAINCENSHQATIAKARSDARKWLAERMNREVWGESKAGINVQIGVAELHLDALRKHGSVSLSLPIVEAKLLPPEDDDGDDGSPAPMQAA